MPYKDKKKRHECQRKNTNKRRQRIRAEAIKRLGGKCVSCGCVLFLEFDHIDPRDKLMCIGDAIRSTKEVFERELKKCQLLCRFCHTRKTNSEFQGNVFVGNNESFPWEVLDSDGHELEPLF